MLGIVFVSLGSVNVEWSLRMAEILKHTPTKTGIFVSKHFRIDTARNKATLEALNSGCTRILYWDTDIVPYLIKDEKLRFEPTIIQHLLGWEYPVVTIPYYTSLLKPSVFKWVGDERMPPFLPVNIDKLKNTSYYADACGLGFTLVDGRIFNLLEKEGYFPWFNYDIRFWRSEQINVREFSEDLWFFNNLRKLGFKVFVDGRWWGKHIHKFWIGMEGKTEISGLR